jgi:hypothetical protein
MPVSFPETIMHHRLFFVRRRSNRIVFPEGVAMKRLGWICLTAAVAVAVAFPVMAQDVVAGEKPKAPKKVVKAKEEQPPVDLTVTGKLSKPQAKYILTLANDVKIALPPVKAAEGEAPAIDLGKFVGKEVTITGKGYRTPATADKPERIRFTSITDVKAAAGGAVEVPPAPVPVAPEASDAPKAL